MVNEMEIFKAACGMDEEQESKSVIRVETKILHLADGGSEEESADVTLDGPCVNIHRSYRYTTVDLEFDESDDELTELMAMLRDFTTPEQSLDVEHDRIPAIVLTIMPKAYDGEYFICGMHGAWCLMAPEAGGGADTVRFIFDNELVHAYQINTDVLEETGEEESEDVYDDRYRDSSALEETEGDEDEEE